MTAIAECANKFKHKVFPVFYHIDPSDVRKQSGPYQKAFLLHTKKFKDDLDKVRRWRRAMIRLTALVGWHVKDMPEFEVVESVVQEVIKTLGHKLSGFDDLVGIEPRVEALKVLLKLGSKNDEFRVIGIKGMGGIGKTTLANVLYDRISCMFDACCFIENVSKTYKDGGAIAIQKQILCQAFNEINLERYSPSEVSAIIGNRLGNINVLIVLDNVDGLKQVQELAIDPKLLHPESRMITTTRDAQYIF
ncbi:disease resistance protein L6-like [Vicia villosa]|uniref:disease resistance protein L6-like n=1 Tax=Vicia villosa TaxID=3911 RepID=UPI00273B3AB8|nr:disease resistance protein L6-like [Vicia villosa]